MSQRELFDDLTYPPGSHRHDPETSQEAERTLTQSGRRQRHGRLVLELVRRYPGCTAIELWQLASEEERAILREPQEVRRRLVDLIYQNLVTQQAARPCRVRGTRMVTWSVREGRDA